MDNQYNNRNNSNNQNPNRPNNKKNRNQGWIALVFGALLLLVLSFAMLQMGRDTDEQKITYNEFLDMVDKGKVEKVVIESDKIVITPKDQQGAAKDSLSALFAGKTEYYTGLVNDDTLPKRLEEAGVQFEQKIPDEGFSVYKAGQTAPENGGIEAMTSATITSNAVVKAVNSAAEVFRTLTKGGN